MINDVTGKGVGRAEKGQEGGFLPLLALPLVMKAMSGKGYSNKNHMDIDFVTHWASLFTDRNNQNTV